MNVPILTFITFAPFVGALLVLAMPATADRPIKIISLASSLVSALLALVALAGFDPAGGLQYIERVAWIPALQVYYHLGVDGLSMGMVLLTALITPLALLAHWKLTEGVKLFFTLFLFLQVGMFGVFTALNFFHWFIFWEIGLIPMFFLIRIWGAEDRQYASLKFFLYTLAGSLGMLLAFGFLYLATENFDFTALQQQAASGELERALVVLVADIERATGWKWDVAFLLNVMFWATFLGFAIKVPIWPFHTWLPDAHTQAPTGGSMVLAAILLKMGVYGFLRIVLPIFPGQVVANLTPLLVLAVASVVLGAFAALAQNDFKRLVAYSSVNHMGYAMLGIFAAVAHAPEVRDVVNEKAAALNGAILQMFNHGISSAALFFLVGVVYERTHTRQLDEYGGLRKVVPIYAGVLGISMFSSLGLPGLNGFVGEFLIFKGAFPVVPWAAAMSLLGLVVTAVFLLQMMQKVCFGPLNAQWTGLPDMTARELVVAGCLMFFMFGIGVYPQPLLRLSNDAALGLIAVFQQTPEWMLTLAP